MEYAAEAVASASRNTTLVSITPNYVATVYQGVAILIMLLFGYLGALTGYYRKEHVAGINKLVFNLGIPCLMYKALATKYTPSLDWQFVALYLIIRFSIAGVAVLFVRFVQRGSIADFLEHWIGLTYINTVVYGIPILTAAYGPSIVIYPVLASVSSVLFQFPIMLFLFELHVSYRAQRATRMRAADAKRADAERAALTKHDDAASSGAGGAHDGPASSVPSEPASEPGTTAVPSADASADASGVGTRDVELGVLGGKAGAAREDDDHGAHVHASPAGLDHEHEHDTKAHAATAALVPPMNTEQHMLEQAAVEPVCEYWACCTNVCCKNPATRCGRCARWQPQSVLGRTIVGLALRPPLWGIILGLIVGATNPTSSPVLHPIIDQFVTPLGDLVTPAAVVAVGIFLGHTTMASIKPTLKAMIPYTLLKVTVVPAMALGLSYAFGHTPIVRNVNVIVAALPIAMASFSLAQEYHVGRTVLSSTVVVGTIIMLPFLVIWFVILGALPA